MKWFCPYCWHEVSEKDITCPNCGADLESFHLMDFDDKLILGLKNPIVQTRMFVIELLGKRQVAKAVPHLCDMLGTSTDTYELIAIIDALFHIGISSATDCIKSLWQSTENHIIRKHIENLLGYNLK